MQWRPMARSSLSSRQRRALFCRAYKESAIPSKSGIDHPSTAGARCARMPCSQRHPVRPGALPTTLRVGPHLPQALLVRFGEAGAMAVAHHGPPILAVRPDCAHCREGYYPMMKLGRRLRSIAHNLADSIGSGLGLPIGHYGMDIYGEAAASANGHITIDFLSGEITGGPASKSLSDAIERYREALPAFCEKHGMPLGAFHEFTVRFSNGPLGRRFLVVVRDEFGRRSATEYGGLQSKRLRVFSDPGRLRPSGG